MVIAVISIINFIISSRRRPVIFQKGAFIAYILVISSSLSLLLSQDWRRYITGLALMYLGVFWFTAISLPLGLAAIKLIVGFMVGAVLGASQINPDLVYDKLEGRSGIIFRGLAAVVVCIFSLMVAPTMSYWFPASSNILIGGLILISMGVLQLGMTTRSIRLIGGLLTLLAGFEVIYATMETSVLVSGLLALVNLGLALVGAYLIAINSMEPVS
jgi:hypothetical protein